MDKPTINNDAMEEDQEAGEISDEGYEDPDNSYL
jgi:hypothetical protein